ncbi:MAG: phosphate ABC transporter substrate-binding protein PstS [Myxococcaceae bacterium]|nr:MAG: phosphate ABC transporter substrate-binding protein PstS [Myxococcaceae bacterium]
MKKLMMGLLLVAGSSASAGGLLINGAGATFPFPIYSKWFNEYNRLHPDIKFNYQSIGSGGGIKQFTDGTVDFGASDAPMKDDQIAKVPDVVHIPTVLGADVVAYNAPGVTGLRFSPATLANIFLGKVARWNDPAIAADNPGLKLPDQTITVARRSDGSGTTYIFTDYLSKISPEWKDKVGSGTSVNWPVGLGGKGNEGVTGIVKSTPWAIGYVELIYAIQQKLPMADLKNKSGSWVKPSLESTTAAAAGVQIPDDYRVSITNPDGKDAYPISGFTYLLVHRDAKDKAKGTAIINFLRWAITDGQGLATALDYAPLPKPVQQKVLKTVETLTVQGTRLSAK